MTAADPYASIDGHRYGASSRWRELVGTLATVSGPDLPAALDRVEQQAESLHPFERVAPEEWITTHKGRPDPRLRVARRLDFPYDVKAAQYAKVMRDPNIAGVVAVTTGSGIGAKVIEPLLASPITRLESVCIESDKLDDAAVTTLLAAPMAAHLRILDLGSTKKLTANALETIARWPGIGALDVLGLGADGIGTSGVEALVAAPIGALRSVSLSHWAKKAPKRWGSALCAAPRPRRLQRLGLYRAGLDDRDLESLARAPFVPTLEALEIKENDFTPAGLAKFLEHTNLASLRALHITWEARPLLTADVARALVASPWLPSLTELLAISEGGWEVLAASDRCHPKLRAGAARQASSK